MDTTLVKDAAVENLNPLGVGVPPPGLSANHAVRWHISDFEYHLDHSCESSSTINKFITDSEGYFRERVLGLEPAWKFSPSMSLGTAFHTKMLQPENFFRSVQTLPAGYRAQASIKCIQSDPAANWVEPGTIEHVDRMAEAVRQSYAQAERVGATDLRMVLGGLLGEISPTKRETEQAWRLLEPANLIGLRMVLGGRLGEISPTKRETEQAWRLLEPASLIGLKVKADLFFVNDLGGHLVDLKTSRDPRPSSFMKSFGRYGYHRQAGLYHHVLSKAYPNIAKIHVWYLAVGTGDHPGVFLYRIPAGTLAIGWDQCRDALKEIRRKLDANSRDAWISDDSMKVHEIDWSARQEFCEEPVQSEDDSYCEG